MAQGDAVDTAGMDAQADVLASELTSDEEHPVTILGSEVTSKSQGLFDRARKMCEEYEQGLVGQASAGDAAFRNKIV